MLKPKAMRILLGERSTLPPVSGQDATTGTQRDDRSAAQPTISFVGAEPPEALEANDVPLKAGLPSDMNGSDASTTEPSSDSEPCYRTRGRTREWNKLPPAQQER